MRNWLARAAANTVPRGGRGNPLARWSRWLGRTGVVRDRAFQSADDPHPGHWRRLPTPWPPSPDSGRPRAASALPWPSCLPPGARVQRHDLDQESDATVARDLGLTVGQERRVLTRARAALRDALHQHVAGKDEC